MYHFNLEPLLQHRKFIEEAKQKDLALIQRELDYESGILAKLGEKQIQLSQEIKFRQTSGMRPCEYSMYRTYASRLAKEIENQQKTVDRIEEKVNLARNELLVAVKDRKTIEKLKEKKKQEFIQTKSKKEQNLINEAAVIRFNRNGQ